MKIQIHSILPAAILTSVVLVVWYILSTIIALPYLFPSPISVGKALVRLFIERNLFYNILYTLYRVLLGFVLGVLLGIGISVIVLLSSFLKRALYPYIVFTAVMPSIVFIPLLMIWLGLSDLLVITAIVVCTSLPIAYSVISASKNIDPEIIDVARTLGITGKTLILKIILPLAITHIASTLKIEAGHSWRIGFITEYLALSTGLGALMFFSYSTLHVDEIIALILVIGFLSLSFQLCIEHIETTIMKKWGYLK